MRINCPNCDAQYEVPNEVVPADGRDVQCSNCGITWFQQHPDQLAKAAIDEDTSSEAAIEDVEDDTRVPRREIDPEVETILREEAQRETIARQAESLETQPDLGLTDPPAAAKPVLDQTPPAPPPPVEEEDDKTLLSVSTAAAGAAIAAEAPRRELLPDIEEINSTLRSAGDRTMSRIRKLEEGAPAPKKKGGFRRGFIFALFFFSVAVLVYVYAPQIAQQVPQVDPWLSSYVTWVDKLRVLVDSQIQMVARWLDATAAASQK